MTHEIDVNKTRSPAFCCKQIGSPVVTAPSDCYFDLPFERFPVLDPAKGEALPRIDHRLRELAFLLEHHGKPAQPSLASRPRGGLRTVGIIRKAMPSRVQASWEAPVSVASRDGDTGVRPTFSQTVSPSSW